MSGLYSERRRNALAGAIAILLLIAAGSVGVKRSFQAYTSGYDLVGSFDAAGQGLLAGSNVKIRGVNVGEVRSIELVDGRAQIDLRIEKGVEIPKEGSTATIRPKTLFGEKFVDIELGPNETTGPYYGDGATFENTVGGFELERVLADAYPVVDAIDPEELFTVLHELALAGEDVGPLIDRSLQNAEALTDLGVRQDANTRRFLADLALLADQLADTAPVVIDGAESLNNALPTLIENPEALNDLLTQTGRLSDDVADLLRNNKAFVDTAFTVGMGPLQDLYDRRAKVIPLVDGIRMYAQTIAEALRLEVGDGTLMAAVKGLLGTQACDVVDCTGSITLPVSAPAAAPPTGTAGADAPPPVAETPPAPDGADALVAILERVL